MKILWLGMLGALLTLTPVEGSHDAALIRLRVSLNGNKAFSKARLSPQNSLILEATNFFVAASEAEQTALISKAGAVWMEALGAAGINDGQTLIVVIWQSGGSLWSLENRSAKKLEEWSDHHLRFTPANTKKGRIFAFLGGQLATGGSTGSQGINAMAGSTLFQNRFNFTINLGYNSVDTSPSTSLLNYGLAGRILFPLSSKLGWNAGAQIMRSSPSIGDATSVISALGGLNFYMPAGSFDVTATVANHNVYGLLAGFTFYLNQK